jgi:hypothetical protein
VPFRDVDEHESHVDDLSQFGIGRVLCENDNPIWPHCDALIWPHSGLLIYGMVTLSDHSLVGGPALSVQVVGGMRGFRGSMIAGVECPLQAVRVEAKVVEERLGAGDGVPAQAGDVGA